MIRRLLMIPVVLVVLASPAPAGFFNRKPKPNAAERVPELLNVLRTSPDESKRQEAADELKQYDPKSFPQILPALIDSLGKDGSTSVRSEAAASIARMRPISQQAGYALEQAQANDASMRVRFSARQALLQYNLVGYRGGKPPEPTADAKANGPQSPANPQPQPVVARAQPQPTATGKMQHGRFQFPETAEPPLADPPTRQQPVAVPVSRQGVPAPLPGGPTLEPLPGGPPPRPAEVPPVPAVPSTPPKTDTDGPSLPSPF